jgi:hypothetical protein
MRTVPESLLLFVWRFCSCFRLTIFLQLLEVAVNDINEVKTAVLFVDKLTDDAALIEVTTNFRTVAEERWDGGKAAGDDTIRFAIAEDSEVCWCILCCARVTIASQPCGRIVVLCVFRLLQVCATSLASRAIVMAPQLSASSYLTSLAARSMCGLVLASPAWRTFALSLLLLPVALQQPRLRALKFPAMPPSVASA